jgi:two-component system, sensor histidine kinase RegB
VVRGAPASPHTVKSTVAQGTQPAPGLAWVIRTRWAAASAQAAAVLVAAYGYGMGLPVGPLLGLVGVTVATNLALAVRLRGRREAPSALLGGALLLDTAVLTVMLHLSGGAANPFSALYLVYIALAAVLLGSGWAWTLVATAVLAYVGLFLVEPVAVPELSGGHGPGECPLHDHAGHAHHGEAGAFDLHLYGMWIAFSVSACLIAFFVTRTAAALDARERQLAQAREQVARTERLAGLTTLAAGSAHELGTPLGTIAVVAKELERGAAQVAGAEQLAEDARVIREQVARCRGILDRMAVQAGESAGEMPAHIGVEALAERARALLTPTQAGRVAVSVGDGSGGADLPVEAMTQVLASLLRNALDASPDGAPVEVAVGGDAQAVWMEVRDRGHGMDEAVRLRATEPFFTTKEAGAGMGLGLFLAQTVVERLGGSLTLEGHEGGGTVARVRVPRHVGGAGASVPKGA